MNYKIILNEKELINFINWLPELNENEVYYISLMTRRKNFPELKDNEIKSFTCSKEDIFKKIKELEIEIDKYIKNEIVIPQDVICLYINTNPRDSKKGTIDYVKNTLLKMLDQERIDFKNSQKQLLSRIHTSNTKKFLIYDIDDKIKIHDFIKETRVYVKEGGYNVIETKNGYHVIVELEKVKKSAGFKWYEVLSSLSDDVGDLMSPIPGTIQCGFMPLFIEEHPELNLQEG